MVVFCCHTTGHVGTGVVVAVVVLSVVLLVFLCVCRRRQDEAS
uniref:4 kDa protein n=1 Tax=Grapevine leafroll-associated virus 3 TaxID=55951 RepID=A0A2S0M301_9CLOS|nr:4 kDa protein [Grapevine leafroll-associated virus 3]AXI82009.1 4 kDa protein [Grapevine leafroll-associated virus 3]